MEQRCNCGAMLPPDSRFCNKCGKPQFEEDIQRIEAFEAEAAPTPVPIPASVVPVQSPGLGNMRAVGITMTAASVALVGVMVFALILFPAVPLVLSAAGFAATRFYSAKQTISAISGAILGTMTGFWIFLVFAFFAMIMSLGLSSPEVQATLKSQPPTVVEAYQKLQDPHQMFALLLLLFFGLTLSAAFGGLLAARLGTPSNR